MKTRKNAPWFVEPSAISKKQPKEPLGYCEGCCHLLITKLDNLNISVQCNHPYRIGLSTKKPCSLHASISIATTCITCKHSKEIFGAIYCHHPQAPLRYSLERRPHWCPLLKKGL